MTQILKSKEVSNAQVLVTNVLVQHSIALLNTDHITLLFKAFCDSKIAQKYASCQIKTTTIINKSFAPHCLDYTMEYCKSHPCSIGTDGSNNTGIVRR